MVLTTVLRFSKRIPLIKFRKGGNISVQASAGGAPATQNQASAAASPQKSSGGQAAAASHSNSIEDWQLPPRYQRKPISAEEMDYINRGGPK